MSLTMPPARIVAESNSPLLAAADSWTRRPLGEVAEILNGFAFKSEQFSTDGGKPLIRIRDLFTESTAVAYAGEYDERYLVEPGELLVGMDGDFNASRWRGPQALLNQRVCKIIPTADQLDIDFLTYLIPGYLQAIHDVTSSTTVTHLSSRDVAQIPIPVPPLAEQRQLAQLFRLAHAKQESSAAHLQAAQRATERFRRAILAAACSGRLTSGWREKHNVAESAQALVARSRAALAPRRATEEWSAPDWLEIPRSWQWAPLRDLAAIRSGIQKQPSRTPKKNRYPYLRVANVLRGRLDLSEIHEFELFDGELDVYRLEPGDLLVVEGNGSPSEIGRAALWRGEIPDCIHQNHIIRVRCIALEPSFLELFWNSPIGSREVAALAVTTAGLYSLSSGKIAAVTVPVPPLNEQREIAARATALLATASGLSSRLEKTRSYVERTFQAVLAKGFRGELNGVADEVGA